MRPAVPESIERRFEIRGQHRARGRNAVWKRVHRFGRDDETGLMGMEDEHGTAHQVGRALLDSTDARVAVFDRSGEAAHLKRGPHAGPFALWHAAIEHERLGAAANPAVQRPHQYVTLGRRRQGLAPNLSAAGRRHPEGSRVVLHPWTF